MRRLRVLFAAMIIASFIFPAAAQFDSLHPYDSLDQRAFCNKVIYTETPDIGVKWRGGLRNISLLSWDMYFNIGNILTVDYLFTGLREHHLYDSTTGDSTTLADNMSIFTLKSRPLRIQSEKLVYKVGGGLKFYQANAEFQNQYGEGLEPTRDNAVVLFITQSWFLPRTQRHLFNLYASLSLRNDTLSSGAVSTWPTLYFVPAYRIYFGKTRHWSAGVEYYLMNPRWLPFKALQYYIKGIDYFSPDQNWISIMFYGISFTTRHVRFDAGLANHYSFTAPFIPTIGFGWNF
jgi:hypothetical protein